MTTVYFIRHAEPNYSNHNDSKRELTKKFTFDKDECKNIEYIDVFSK